MRGAVLSLVFLVASSIGGATPKIWEEFSGENALRHVQYLVDLGPRPAASVALAKSRDYIEKELRNLGWEVTRQSFTEGTPRGTISFVNMIARFGKKPAPSFLLCSHYDTKIFDTFRFVGANDGGSSTGLLLEMARVLSLHPELAAKIELVFFDGEEAFEEFSKTDGIYGSRYFARQLVESKTAKQFRGGVLFDMIGDRSLTVTLPPNSPGQMMQQILAAADVLKSRDHFTFFEGDITDDHSPLNAIGIPTIDLIDFDFPAWHTAGDTMDKVSAESLQTVGRVAAYYLSESALK
jgi:Zn-dependent M28 family amino/carboxypeptidase